MTRPFNPSDWHSLSSIANAMTLTKDTPPYPREFTEDTWLTAHLYKRCAVLKKERDEMVSDATLEVVLREAAIYREMVSVLQEQLHEAYRRERYRKNRDDDTTHR